jgi:glutamate formiminotransferase / 5-formyltetrahydrofolate cyclo-ligase
VGDEWICQSGAVLECVANISEGRNREVLQQLVAVCADDLLDVHVDPDHNRSVFTLLDVDAPRRLARQAVELLHLDAHQGVHPRLGVVDVVPFVPLKGSTIDDAIVARDAFANWVSSELLVPCFLYGTERALPDIRRDAWTLLQPQCGPSIPHLTAGAMCVGARGDGIRTLALQVGDQWQVSMNLIEPERIGPDIATDRVLNIARRHNVVLDHCELVGLIAHSALERISENRWDELDLSSEQTIEFRRQHGYTFVA